MSSDRQSRTDVPVVVVVGNRRNWGKEGRILPDISGFHFVGFAEIGTPLFDEIEPEIVLSALMGEGFDAIDLARKLHLAGFQGRYRAVTMPLPYPQAVIDEIRAAAPSVDFDLFVVSGPIASS